MIWEAAAIVIAIGVPAGGWVISVERRLSEAQAIKDRVDSIDEKLDLLVAHLIDKRH